MALLYAMMATVSLAVALVLALRGVPYPGRWPMVLAVGLFGLWLVKDAAVEMGWLGLRFDTRASFALGGIMSSNLLQFLLRYANWSKSRWRGVLEGLALTPALFVMAALLVAPEVFFDGAWLTEPALIADATFLDLEYVVAALTLGVAFLRTPPGRRRDQMMIAYGAMLVWAMNHGAAGTALVLAGGSLGDWVLYVWWLAPVPIIITSAHLLVLALVAVRYGRERGRGDLAILGIGLLALPLGLVQVWAGMVAHMVIDFGSVVIVAYGVMRYQILDIDLRLKWTVSRSTMAAVFVAVFFAVSELAAEYFTTRTGSTVLGIGAAALLVFAVAPLQRFADRLSDQVVSTDASPAYLDYRRLEIYKTALEGMLADGAVDVRESHLLHSLRRKLGISEGDHQLMLLDAQGGPPVVA